MLNQKVQKPDEVKDSDFHAFSFYYDLAADVGLIGTFALIIHLFYFIFYKDSAIRK